MTNPSEVDCYNNRRQREFEDRMERAFDPHTRHSLTDRGEISMGGDGGMSALFAALGALENDEDIPDMRPGPRFNDEELEAIRAEHPAIQIERDYTSRYDRQFKKRVALENELPTHSPEEPRYHEVMAELAEVKRRIKIELERAIDDTYRERERIDEYKLTAGKDERNASRRVRSEANVMTPKEVLAAETPEEKAKRIHERKMERQAQRRAERRAAKDAK
ncbi:hypothetical protein ACGYLI_00050 [Sulfitobacter sp. 1A13421]|uniref:hypothetical protein n=1 Tax=Sulfitobacter sp. 1A13421 TaxID=3368595 RepID=UPI0037461E38